MDVPKTSNNFQTFLSLGSLKVDCDILCSTDPEYFLEHGAEKMVHRQEDPKKDFLRQYDIIVPSSHLETDFFQFPIGGECSQVPRCPFYSKSGVRREGVRERGNWMFLLNNGWIERL